MSTQLEVEEARTKLDRTARRVKQMMLDAKGADLDLDQEKNGVLFDLKRRLAHTHDLLLELQGATVESAEHAAEEFEEAWEDLQQHVDRAMRAKE